MFFKKKKRVKVRSDPPPNSTTCQKIVHLSTKACNYEREAEKLSKNISRVKTTLTFGNLLLTIAMLALYMVNKNSLIDDVILNLSLIILGLLMGVITLLLALLVSGKKARKLIEVSTLFSELNMECHHAEIRLCEGSQAKDNELVLKEYIRLSKKYKKLRGKYVKHRKRYTSYYRFIGGSAGSIYLD